MASSFAVSFARETWALYGVGVLAVVLRLIARIRRLTAAGLQIDDALMVFALLWYTILCVSLNKVASGGGSNLMTADDIAALTPEIHDERVRGSKWVFVSEHAMVLTIWTLKFCMLIIYGRITDGLKQSRLVIYAGVYTLLCFIGTEFALFFACRPLSLYFAVPTPNYQCSSYQHYEIAQGTLSISSDILILIVAMPILIAVRLPRRQKIILLLLFGLGLFDIVAAVLTKVYCLVPALISYQYMNWYFREATIAMLVTNLPLMWSLVRDMFPGLKKWMNGSDGSYQPHTWPKEASSARRSRQSRQSRDMNLQSFRSGEEGWSEDFKEPGSTTVSASREHTISNAPNPSTTSSEGGDGVEKGKKGTIHIQNDVTLEVENVKRVDGAYPVWDWNGNRDHVSATDIAGGSIGMAR